MNVAIIFIFVFVLVVTFAAILKRYRRCPSDKILVIYGKTGNRNSAKCIHGGAAFIWPVFQSYSYLDLTPISIECNLTNALSKQNIRVDVPCRFTVGISTEPESMTNAAERLLGLTIDDIRNIATDILFGQLRLVIATMDIEEINSDRDKFLANVSTNVEAELKRYMESSAEPQPQAQPEPAPVDTLATVDMPDLAQDEQQPSGNSQAWHLIIDLVLAIIALAALYLAWKAQASARRLRDNYIEDIEAVNKNMEQLAEEMSQHINTLSSKIATQRRNTMHDFTTEHRESKPTREHKPEPKSDPKPARRGPAKTLYLSKPDDNECFMRATETFELGNSIYVLTTHDGVHGEFSVIENSDVHRFALMMPSENLTRACSGNAIQMSAGKTRIVTDREGEAHFENGQWHVIVKAIIHYE